MGRAKRAAAVVNAGLAAFMLVIGTLGVASRSLLGWVWVIFGVVFTILAFLWLRGLRASRVEGAG